MDRWVVTVWGEIYIKHTFHVYCNVNMEMIYINFVTHRPHDEQPM